jgi:hypothetical protein
MRMCGVLLIIMGMRRIRLFFVSGLQIDVQVLNQVVILLTNQFLGISANINRYLCTLRKFKSERAC